MTPDELLTPVEVAAILRCSTKTVARRRQSGRLKAEKQSPRVFRYRRSDVDFFRDQCREDANLTEQ